MALSVLLYFLEPAFRALYVALALAFYLLLLKCNNLRYFSNVTALTLIFTNLTATVGPILGRTAQEVSLLLLLVLSANVCKTLITSKTLVISERNLWISLNIITFLFLLPSIFFFINSPDLLEDYIFWAKRILLIVALAHLAFLGSVFSIGSIQFFVQIVFVINCLGVIASFYLPGIFMNLIDLSDPLIESGVNPMGGGFFLNPNGAALSIIFAYVGLIYFKKSIAPQKQLGYAVLLFIALAVSGSRSGFMCGVLVLFLGSGALGSTIRIRFNLKAVIPIIVVIVCAYLVLANVVEGGYAGGVTRIIDIKNEGNLASNELRWAALISAMDLLVRSPITGSGFGLRTRLLELQPHNSYLAFAIDVGLIGLILFPIFILLIFRKMLIMKDSLNFRLTIAPVLFMGIFDHEVVNSKSFGFLLFLAITLSNVRLYDHISERGLGRN